VLVARAAGDGPTNNWTHHDLSEKDGSFRISGLAAGDVVVDVSCSEGHDALTRAPAKAPAADVRFVLRRDGGVSFRLRVPTGAVPPKKYAVSMLPRGPNRSSTMTITQQTFDWSDGAARVAGANRAWTVVFIVEGYLPVWRDADVAPGADASLGDIVLEPGPALEGRIVDTAGVPVKNAAVSVGGRGPTDSDASAMSGWRFTNGGGETFVDGFGARTTAFSDAGGAFRIEHLLPGRRSVVVKAAGYVPTTVECDVAVGAAPLVVTLRHGGVLRCTIRDADGKPATGVVVDATVDDPGGGLPWTCRMSGGVDGAFAERVREGRAHVVVRRGEKTLATKDVDVREGAESSVEITLEK